MPRYKLFLSTAIMAVFGFSTPALADGEKITDIRIKGNHRIESAVIMNAVSLKSGDTLLADKTDADIRAIYKLGHFQNVQALKEESDNGVVLIYSVVEKPIVREIVFDGNKELSTEKLKDAFGVKINSVFSAKDLATGITKIRKLYSDDGYYLADIQSEVKITNPTDRTIRISVTEGSKVLIRNIRFDGNRAFSDRKLKGIIETGEKWFMSWLTNTGTYKEDQLKNDAMLISDFYLNNGYINVKVGEPVVKLNMEKTEFDVTISIAEGEQFRIGSINFKGDLLVSADELRSKLKSSAGEIFNRSILRGDIAVLTDFFGDKGYAFANINPQSRINEPRKLIDIDFEVEKGELVYIERIRISGNPKTRDKVVRREMRVTEDNLFSASGMRQSKQNLMNLGFFEEANVSTAKGSAPNRLNVNVEVKEKPTGTFSIGGGYSSLDGLIAQGSVQQSNFLGLGLKGVLAGSIGGKSSTYSIGLTDPYFLDSKWTLGGDIYRNEREYSDYSRRLTGGDIKTGYPISDSLRISMMYKYEIKDIFHPSDTYQTFHDIDAENYPIGRTTTSSISGNISYSSLDYRLEPTKGIASSLSFDYAGLGGDNRYARVVGDAIYFRQLYKKLIGSAKLTLGYVGEVGMPIPIDEKFYLGGIHSLRGYATRTVSPYTNKLIKDVNGGQTYYNLYLGGDKEYYGNFEMTFPLLADVGMKGVAFFDYGNAFTDNKTAFTDIRMSYGGGIRWASPMGPLRLEYGIPVNPRKGLDSSSGRFEFSIGTMF